MDRFPREFVSANGLVFVIDVAKVDDTEELAEFMDQQFLSRTPNREIVSYDAEEDSDDDNQLDWADFIRDSLSDPHSLVARDQATGSVVAFRWNKMETRNDREQKEDQMENRLIWALLNALKRDVDLYTMYETEKIFHFRTTCVHDGYGQLGLASELNRLAIDLAKAAGAGGICVEAVSEYAARSLAKLGFDTLKSIDYATFEYNGVFPLAGNQTLLDKHPTARYMALRLSS